MGTVIDPMADKSLMTVVTVCLAVKAALPGSSIHDAMGIDRSSETDGGISSASRSPDTRS